MDQEGKPYEDIRTLIEEGFLTHNLIVRGVPLVLRSLFPQEIQEILLQSYGEGFLCYQRHVVTRSLYSVRGVLITQKNFHTSLFDLVCGIPLQILKRLYCEIQGLLSRYSKCFALVEGFSYESQSRTLWLSHGKTLPKNTFGLENGIQHLWRVYNIYEDLYEQSEDHWNNAKFMASAMSPKGVKKIYQKDKESKRQEKARREKKIFDCIARYKGEYIEELETEKQTPILVTAKTEEELMEEYHRWVRGEKDKHDLIVEEYKDKIRTKMDDKQREHQEKIAELQDLEETRGIFASTQLAPATKEQLEQAGFRRGVRTLQGENQRNRLYNRYLGKEEIHGDFYVGSDGNVKIK